MTLKRFSKSISRIQAIIIIAILLSSITIAIVAWNFTFFGTQTISIEPEFPNEEPTPDPSNIEAEVPTKEPTEPQEPVEPEQPTEQKPNEDQTTESPSTQPNVLEWAHVRIGDENYFFNPTIVETTRPDLFKPGHFSMFDILVHLDKENKIELDYHFDESMNTHIIDSINGEPNWWYITFYSGGWTEQNVFRPDHYSWKPLTTLRFYQTSPQNLADIYSVWKQEIEMLESNNGKIIIPEVIIRGNTFTNVFENVEVTTHNLRNDTFQENTITAIDVILSLADQGEMTYELQWYDTIGTASIVRSYWVDTIDNDKAYDRCGFVYEAGADRYRGFTGNHIHLPSDTRILNSPEYVEFFWICI